MMSMISEFRMRFVNNKTKHKRNKRNVRVLLATTPHSTCGEDVRMDMHHNIVPSLGVHVAILDKLGVTLGTSVFLQAPATRVNPHQCLSWCGRSVDERSFVDVQHAHP